MTTVLVLEDEPVVMRLARNILKRHNVIEAASGEEALLRFIDHDHRIDLLIADVTLPRVSGIQVALLLRSRIPKLPVILTSGHPVSSWRTRDADDLERLGPDSVTVLQKPFPAEALRHAVSELLGEPQTQSARTV